MSILYDLFENPPGKEEKEGPWLHARPKVISTWRTEEISEHLKSRSSISLIDLKSLLKGVSEIMIQGLSNSHNIYLEGIGTFSVSLQSKPVKNKKDIRAASIAVKGINFRPDPQLKKELKSSQVKRVSETHQRVKYGDEERRNRILHYMGQKDSVNVTTIMQLNQCSHAKASEDLNDLVESGAIQMLRSGRLRIYYLK